ncbi:monocarboxylate transporter 12-like [Amphibalanus amphitrite]|uniref:monocarboxylate transporter 12-like n=1 Tax=Amphibalanus amphitrite TaxID=1232801 RepID=UPI001C921593|nr:monocarboxylate transporter 12-like [Amphibalanus amphitrite]
MEAVWLGSLNICVSLLVTPLVVGLCRRKSTRLTAVLGGLVAALACLFASFAQQLHQVFLSYGLVLGIGIGLTRETSDLMTGQYFKRRREFVEIIVQSGAGIGLTLVSTILRYSVGRVGWRLGLQAVTGIVFSTFIIGIFYRSASLYHPQRRAILHLKNQKRKVKEKKEFKLKNPKPEEKPPYLDWSVLKARTVQVLVVSSMFSGLGLYTPVILLMVQCEEEGLDDGSLGLLQTFLGLALALGCLGCGVIVVRPSSQCWISRQYLCQATLLGIAISLMALAVIEGYHGYVLFAWLYGFLLGGYRYAIKVYTFERVRARNFSRAWSLVQAAGALSSLLAAPVTGYINRSSPKAGYYFSSVMVLLSACVFFMMNFYRKRLKKMDTTLSYTTVDSQLSSGHGECHLSAEHESSGGGAGAAHQGVCTCAIPPEEGSAHSAGAFQRAPPLQRIGKSISFANSVDVLDDKLLERGPDGLTCISEEGLLDQLENYSYFFPGDCITSCDKVENFLLQTERSMGRNAELFLHRPLRMAATVSLSEPELRSRLGDIPEFRPPPPQPVQRPSILRNGSQRSNYADMGTIDEMTTSV